MRALLLNVFIWISERSWAALVLLAGIFAAICFINYHLGQP